MTRAEIQASARRWVGRPYKDHGRDAHGIDCVGLIIVMAEEFGLRYVDEPFYSRWASPHRRMLEILDDCAARCDPAAPFPGTIGVFVTEVFPAHVGVFTEIMGIRHLVHARSDHGQVFEQPFQRDRFGTTRLLRRYAFPGMEDQP